VLEAGAAEADLRNVVREVAAEDASSTSQAQLRRNGRR
jgi:hypothetical protein